MPWQRVANKIDVQEGCGISVQAPGRRKPIALFRSQGQYFAVNDECPHAYAHLSGSAVSDFIITCQWHGAQFDVRTGKAVGPLAYGDLRIFPVRLNGDDIEVEI